MEEMENEQLEQELAADGWSQAAIASAIQGKFAYDKRIGSPLFEALWQASYPPTSQKAAQELLEIILHDVEMPLELTGTVEEVKDLFGRFASNLAPDHRFWGQLAWTVQLAFPGKSLSQPSDLARRVHQFRYVISMQQAEWIRAHVKQVGMTDAQALAIFLKPKRRRNWFWPVYDYSVTDSARLHNKIAWDSRQIDYPDGQTGPNLKVLLDFHTEFILSAQGDFLNELDPQGLTQNGVVNGASFNYADSNGEAHRRLDVEPVKPHDPAYRKRVMANDGHPFRAPRLIRKKWWRRTAPNWETSYFNAAGSFARNGRSNARAVAKLGKEFVRTIKKS